MRLRHSPAISQSTVDDFVDGDHKPVFSIIVKDSCDRRPQHARSAETPTSQDAAFVKLDLGHGQSHSRG